jgi:hypothetical protein
VSTALLVPHHLVCFFFFFFSKEMEMEMEMDGSSPASQVKLNRAATTLRAAAWLERYCTAHHRRKRSKR